MSQEATMPQGVPAGDFDADGDAFLSRLPPWVVDTLTSAQKEAIHEAMVSSQWKTHPVDIRLSLPFPGRRYYMTILAGEERRSAERRHHERHRYPLRTVANVFFFLGLATIFYVVVLMVMAVHSAIIEF